jgi:hypothetical protein
METITNLTQTASKAIWGDSASSEEPVSGVTGDVSKGEPYDAGNIEHREYQTEPTSTEHDISHEEVKHASEIKDSSTESGDMSKAQNDTRHPDDPKTDPEDATTKARNTVDDTSGGTDQNTNPDKIDGPGPKPSAEVATENGGDAGNASSSDSVDKKEGGAPAGGDNDEEEDGPQKTSHGEGTGEQYVKSSGLKADGGDFDAAAPGAGREADRLLEEKGVHKEDTTVATSKSNESVQSKGSSASGGKEKTSLKDKIKAKFHKSNPSQ